MSGCDKAADTAHFGISCKSTPGVVQGGVAVSAAVGMGVHRWFERSRATTTTTLSIKFTVLMARGSPFRPRTLSPAEPLSGV